MSQLTSANIKITDIKHDDPEMQQYIEENADQYVKLWWDNIGFFSFQTFIKWVVKNEKERRNAERK